MLNWPLPVPGEPHFLINWYASPAERIEAANELNVLTLVLFWADVTPFELLSPVVTAEAFVICVKGALIPDLLSPVLIAEVFVFGVKEREPVF